MAVLRTNLLSRCLGRQVDFHAIIPTYQLEHTNLQINPYAESKPFPVLVLLHGFSGDCNDYLTFTNLVRYAEKHRLAVLLPSGCNSGYIDDPNGAKMHSFIAYELLEACRFLFPISSKREETFIGGLSMGAMGAARIALAHPEIFSEVFMMSGAPVPLQSERYPMTWFGKDEKYYSGCMPGTSLDVSKTQEDAYYQAEKNIRENKELPRFVMSVGTEDGLLGACEFFYQTLNESGYDISLTKVSGYGHEWDFWEKELRQYIETRF